MIKRALSVSQLLTEIKRQLEGNFYSVNIEGEVSNLTKSTSNHWYFTLSDRDASINACLFKMDAARNPIINKIKNGDKVNILGPVNVFAKRGSFQIVAKVINMAGKGDLQAEFLKLKRKLADEGLFDLDVKKEIPAIPKRIAVVTAPRSAALQDFLKIFSRRARHMNILIVPALVQGDNAPSSILAALAKIYKYNQESTHEQKIDTVVLARGGGSLEDLNSFNDETLAREIFHFPVPIISAIGHQTDYTISDMVADMRAETPSAAAEQLTEKQKERSSNLEIILHKLIKAMSANIIEVKAKLDNMSPTVITSKLWGLYTSNLTRLNNCNLKDRANELLRFYEYNIRIDDSISSLKNSANKSLTSFNSKLATLIEVLNSLNPKNVLKRGYAIITDQSRRTISSLLEFKKLSHKERLNISFFDGKCNVSKEDGL